MRGITVINDDLYYERPDGAYVKLPYEDGEATGRILIERATREELDELRDLLRARSGLQIPQR
jgi:hypothetical protein